MALGWVRSFGRSGTFLSKSHPYAPANAPIPSFRPNESPLWVVVASFGAIVASVLALSVVLARRYNPKVKSLFALCWFTLCGFLHCGFEAYFIFNHDRIAGMQGLFAQLWKEYALGDSRYLTLDPFILSIETLTILVWGPLCVATAVSIARSSPLRHPLQLIVCIGHLYGVALYYTTSFADFYVKGVAHSRPEFLYFWVYFAGMNLPWAVVPAVLLADSFKTLRKAATIMVQVEAALGRKHRPIQSLPAPPVEPRVVEPKVESKRKSRA